MHDILEGLFKNLKNQNLNKFIIGENIEVSILGESPCIYSLSLFFFANVKLYYRIWTTEIPIP